MNIQGYTENAYSNRSQQQAWFFLLTAFLALIIWTSGAAAEVVNINKANASAMQENLPGIGPVKSQAIVDYRNKHGSFKSLDDLKNVPGIGDATVKKIRSKASTNKGMTKASKDFKAKSASSSHSEPKSAKSKSSKSKSAQSHNTKDSKTDQKKSKSQSKSKSDNESKDSKKKSKDSKKKSSTGKNTSKKSSSKKTKDKKKSSSKS